MKKALIMLTSLFTILFISSCIFIGASINGNGKVVEQTRNLGEFDKISVTRGMNVFISQGESCNIVVKADENLLEYIETTVDDGTLKVSCTRNIRKASSKKVFVTLPDLESLKTTAGSNVNSETPIKAKKLEIKSNAGSNVRMSLDAGALTLSATSGSNIYLDGITRSLKLKVNSGANIKAGELKTEDCEVEMSSGANVWINASSALKGSISSGANLFYTGEPATLQIEKSSGGNLIKK